MSTKCLFFFFFWEYNTAMNILPSADCDSMLPWTIATHDSVPVWPVIQFQSSLPSITPKSNFSWNPKLNYRFILHCSLFINNIVPTTYPVLHYHRENSTCSSVRSRAIYFSKCMYRTYRHLSFFCNVYFYPARNAEKVFQDYTCMYHKTSISQGNNTMSTSLQLEECKILWDKVPVNFELPYSDTLQCWAHNFQSEMPTLSLQQVQGMILTQHG